MMLTAQVPSVNLERGLQHGTPGLEMDKRLVTADIKIHRPQPCLPSNLPLNVKESFRVSEW